jgi:hypothetical protein
MICEQPNPIVNVAPVSLLCSTMMCQNGGRCIQYTSTSAICFCPRGYNGQFCERTDGSVIVTTPADLCSNLVCLNGILTRFNILKSKKSN